MSQKPWEHIQEEWLRKTQRQQRDGHPPDVQILRAVVAGDRLTVPQEAEEGASEGWCDLMKLCWAHDPQDRPTFNTVFKTLSEMYVRDRHRHPQRRTGEIDIRMARHTSHSTRAPDRLDRASAHSRTFAESSPRMDSADINIELYHLMDNADAER